MEGTSGNGPAGHFAKQLRRDRLARRLSVAELARLIGVNPAHLGRVESAKRPPTVRLAALLDGVFTDRRGWYSQYLEDIRTAPEIPATFRSWSDYEERSGTLRAWMPSIVHGLAQSTDYAAVLIALEPGIASATADARLKARLERQRRVLGRTDPPRVTLLVDEVALWRLVGSAPAMTAQMSHLADVAAMPNVTVQVVPAIAHAAVASGYVLTDDAAWCEHLAAGGVFTDPDIVANIAARHDSLRSECYRASESLAMIAEAGTAWASGVSPLTRRAAAGTA
jgi:transcriptional regulator with XRE-family HTH domain